MSHEYVLQNNNWWITDTHPKNFGSLASVMKMEPPDTV